MEIEYKFYFPEIDITCTWTIKKSYLSKSRMLLDKIKDNNNLIMNCIIDDKNFTIDRMINVKEDI